MTSWQSAPVLATIAACERPRTCPHGLHARGCHCGSRICDCDGCNERLIPIPLPQVPTRSISPRPVVASLLRDVAAGIRVLHAYGVDIAEEQVMERANNLVTSLIGNYDIREAP